MTRDARRKPRISVQERVRLHWKDRYGQLKSAVAEALDVSVHGIRLRLSQPVETQTMVNLECRSLKIAGVAVVRHCLRTSVNHYTVGLQFAGGLEWRGTLPAPAAELPALAAGPGLDAAQVHVGGYIKD